MSIGFLLDIALTKIQKYFLNSYNDKELEGFVIPEFDFIKVLEEVFS